MSKLGDILRNNTWDGKPRKEAPYEHKSVRGYLHRGKVANMLADGWEVIGAQAVMIEGTTLFPKQQVFNLRRPNPKYTPEGEE